MDNISEKSNYELTGIEPQPDEVKIFIERNILNGIKDFLKSDLNNEQGGVLVGEVKKNEIDSAEVIIHDYIIASDTEANISRLTFTHRTWENINKTLEEKFPEYKIVGWFHSHPGHSVFLSEYDEFIHSNFFDKENGTAYVFDPIINESAFFINKESKPVKCSGYYLFDSVIKTEVHNTKISSKRNYFLIFIIIICPINIFLTVYYAFQYYTINETVDKLKLSLVTLEMKNDELKRKYDSESIYKETFKKSFPYKIKDGDTMKKISYMFFNDTSKVNVLIKSNNLRDEYDIKTGQVLEIPVIIE